MDQLHKRFTDEQIKVLFQLYCQGLLTGADVQEMLHIGKGAGSSSCSSNTGKARRHSQCPTEEPHDLD